MAEQVHILVVEDEQHLALGIKYNLLAEGYQVTTLGDGPSALRLLEESPQSVDLVVLDLMLPGMSGYAVCEEIRARDMELPILILTARTLTEDRTRGFEAGANQYLAKPFDLDEFLARVKNLLTYHGRRKRQAAGSRIRDCQFGNARINFETFEVIVSGQPVRMTQLEMSLLRYFVEHAASCWKRSGACRAASTRAPPTSSSAACARSSSPIPRSHAISSPSATPVTASLPNPSKPNWRASRPSIRPSPAACLHRKGLPGAVPSPKKVRQTCVKCRLQQSSCVAPGGGLAGPVQFAYHRSSRSGVLSLRSPRPWPSPACAIPTEFSGACRQCRLQAVGTGSSRHYQRLTAAACRVRSNGA